jgi:hypothetical protein
MIAISRIAIISIFLNINYTFNCSFPQSCIFDEALRLLLKPGFALMFAQPQ